MVVDANFALNTFVSFVLLAIISIAFARGSQTFLLKNEELVLVTATQDARKDVETIVKNLLSTAQSSSKNMVVVATFVLNLLSPVCATKIAR